jgi:RecA-family ATPase
VSFHDDEEDDKSYELENGFELYKPAPPKEWIIDGVLPKGMTVLYGEHSVGKSFTAMSMAGAVLTGKPWLGKYPVSAQGPVVYLSMEGQFPPRWAAYCKEHGIAPTEDIMYDDGQELKHETTQLWVKRGVVRLSEPREVERLI